MIDPHDLMLGNYLRFKLRQGRLCDIHKKYYPGPKGRGDVWILNSYFLADVVYPITITHKWLEGMGIKHLKTDEHLARYKTANGFYVGIWQQDTGVDTKGSIFCGPSELPVKYIHEVQNIYWMHTKQQLVRVYDGNEWDKE